MKQYLKKSKGFTLLEVLVSVIVLSFGLLGMAGLQATSLKANMSAYHRSQATMLGFQILESMRANRDATHDNGYNITLASAAPTTTGTVAQNDLKTWFVNVGAALPGGDAAIACDANNVCSVTVQWDVVGGNKQQFLVSTEI